MAETSKPTGQDELQAVPAARAPSAALKIYLKKDEEAGLNPFWHHSASAEALFSLLYRRPLQVQDNGHIIYDLLEDIQLSSDHRQILLHLKEGLTFHDGSPLQALDLVSSLEAYAGQLGSSDGEELALKWEAREEEGHIEDFHLASADSSFRIPENSTDVPEERFACLEAYRILDERSVILYLSEADDRLIWQLSFPVLSASDVHTALPSRQSGAYTLQTNSFPLSLKAYSTASRLQDIEVWAFEDDRLALAALENAELDLVLLTEQENLAQMKRQGQNTAQIHSLRYDYMSLGQASRLSPEWRDKLVRIGQSAYFVERLQSERFAPAPWPLALDRSWLGLASPERVREGETLFQQTQRALKTEVLELSLLALPDQYSQECLRQVGRIFSELGFQIRYLEPSTGDYEAVYKSGHYDLALQSLELCQPLDPARFWRLALPSEQSAWLETLQAPQLTLKVALAPEAGIIENFWTNLSMAPPLFGLGFREQGLLLSNRVEGQLVPSYQQAYGGIEDLYVWP